MSSYEEMRSEISKYHEESDDKWWDLEAGWQHATIVKANAESIIEYVGDRINYEWYTGASAKRDLLEIAQLKEWMKENPSFDKDTRLMARVAGYLENENWHPLANYIRDVLIAGVPEEVNVRFRRAIRQ